MASLKSRKYKKANRKMDNFYEQAGKGVKMPENLR